MAVVLAEPVLEGWLSRQRVDEADCASKLRAEGFDSVAKLSLLTADGLKEIGLTLYTRSRLLEAIAQLQQAHAGGTAHPPGGTVGGSSTVIAATTADSAAEAVRLKQFLAKADCVKFYPAFEAAGVNLAALLSLQKAELATYVTTKGPQVRLMRAIETRNQELLLAEEADMGAGKERMMDAPCWDGSREAALQQRVVELQEEVEGLRQQLAEATFQQRHQQRQQGRASVLLQAEVESLQHQLVTSASQQQQQPASRVLELFPEEEREHITAAGYYSATASEGEGEDSEGEGSEGVSQLEVHGSVGSSAGVTIIHHDHPPRVWCRSLRATGLGEPSAASVSEVPDATHPKWTRPYVRNDPLVRCKWDFEFPNPKQCEQQLATFLYSASFSSTDISQHTFSTF
jgi:hypothetical protein